MRSQHSSIFIQSLAAALICALYVGGSLHPAIAQASMRIGLPAQGQIAVSASAQTTIESTGSDYQLKIGSTSRSYSDANTAIDAGLASLTAGRTRNQVMALRGTFQLTRTITLPSYTTIDMYGATLKTAASYSTTFTTNTNAHSIVMRGGTINGNKNVGHGIDFYGVDDFVIQDIAISYTWDHSVHLVNCTDGLVKNVEASHAELMSSSGNPVGQDGFVVTKVSSNITFDSVYVHDIWMEYQPRPDYQLWGGGIELMTYPSAEPSDITVVNSRFVHLGEFGVGVSTNGAGLNVHNIKVNNNTFQDIGKEAVDACYVVNAQITNNSISHTERYGIQLYAVGSTSTDVIISNNKITDAGYLTGYTDAGINTDGNGPMDHITLSGNTLRCVVGFRLTPQATTVFVDGNDFNTCGTDVVNYSASVTWGTNINQNGLTITGKQP